MRISVVIGTYNEGDQLWKTVEACIATLGELEADFIVADDASTDGSIQSLRDRFPQVRILEKYERSGVAPTRDLAARNANESILIFLDAHCKPEPFALATLAASVEATEGLAIITPCVVSLDVRYWHNLQHKRGYGYKANLLTMDTSWIDLTQMRQREALYESPCMIGCAFAMSKALYRQLRGTDPQMLVYGIEDLDLGLQCWLMGYSILHNPRAVVGHRNPNMLLPEAHRLHSLSNSIRLARKHFSDPVWDDWLARFVQRHRSLWRSAWYQFERAQDSAEQERTFLLTNRNRDELWYADRFGLTWPPCSLTVSLTNRLTSLAPLCAGPPVRLSDSDGAEFPENNLLRSSILRNQRRLRLDHTVRGSHFRIMHDADAIGTSRSAAGHTVHVYLKLKRLPSGTIEIIDASFVSDGDERTLACVGLLMSHIDNMTPELARDIAAEDLLWSFGAGQRDIDAARLATEALADAIKDY